MAPPAKLFDLSFWYAALDKDGVALVTMARVIHGLLGTHAVVDEVGEELGVTLRLHRSTHHPEGGPQSAVFGGEAGDDRVQGALVGLEGVRMPLHKAERLAPVLEAHASAFGHDATTEAHVQAVYE